METFIYGFMECDGIPMRHTSKECMTYLQNILGYFFEVARGVLGLAVARGYVAVSAYAPVKRYVVVTDHEVKCTEGAQIIREYDFEKIRMLMEDAK